MLANGYPKTVNLIALAPRKSRSVLQRLSIRREKKGIARETSPLRMGLNSQYPYKVDDVGVSKVKSYDVKEKDFDFLIEG